MLAILLMLISAGTIYRVLLLRVKQWGEDTWWDTLALVTMVLSIGKQAQVEHMATDIEG